MMEGGDGPRRHVVEHDDTYRFARKKREKGV